MSYTVNFSDSVSKGSITVEDNTVNQETSISLPGKSTTSARTLVGVGRKSTACPGDG